MKFLLKFKWYVALLILAILYFSTSLFFKTSTNENIFPRSHQKDGGKAFLDFLRLKGFQVTESYESLTNALPRLLHRNRSTTNPQMLILPERSQTSILKLSEIEPLLNFLSRGNTVTVFTENPEKFLTQLEAGFQQDNSAESQYYSRKNPAMQMALTIRQLLQELAVSQTKPEINYIDPQKDERTMESFLVTCRNDTGEKQTYVLAGELKYLSQNPERSQWKKLVSCYSNDLPVALAYHAFGGIIKFISLDSLLQNRYVAESDNINFLSYYLQADTYSEILWSEFHNHILLETNLIALLVADWRGRLLIYVISFILLTLILYSLRIQKFQYRIKRERLSLHTLLYPAQLLQNFKRKKIKQYISLQNDNN